MKKEELTNIINLISERDWTPLYEEGCERAGHNRSPYDLSTIHLITLLFALYNKDKRKIKRLYGICFG
jgi:hypothetical protein